MPLGPEVAVLEAVVAQEKGRFVAAVHATTDENIVYDEVGPVRIPLLGMSV